jgi:hypothetical protein
MGRRNLAPVEKIAISEVSCEYRVGGFLRFARPNPQTMCSGGWNYQCSVLQRCNGKTSKQNPRVRPGMCESDEWFLLHDNAPSHNVTIVKLFLTQRKVTVLDHPPYSPDLTPASYIMFSKVKFPLKVRLIDLISDIQKSKTVSVLILRIAMQAHTIPEKAADSGRNFTAHCSS